MLSILRALGVALLVLFVVCRCGVAVAADVQPLAEKDVLALVSLQIDEAAIVARIASAGLAFEADAAAIERLRQAGASQAVVEAVEQASRAKKPPVAAITFDQVLQLVSLGIDEPSILKRLEQSPTTFTLSAAQVAQLKQAGASETLIAALQGPRPISAQAAELITDLAIVLDCSGSMRELTREGEMKMAAARRVVTDLVHKMPEGLNVAFLIYGHEVFSPASDPRNCQAVKVVRPLTKLDAPGKSALVQVIAGLKPVGATPIALSLRTAGTELAKKRRLLRRSADHRWRGNLRRQP